ncbi:sensor domain-containing protein [Actinoplanes sp. NPDC049596]|uniref:sensor domain-containing protein n=1 Tax=unclassified Actinoplanes TaxID=2626549 RepID=UPI00344AE08F
MTTTQLEAPVMAVRPLARVGADTRYVLTGFPVGIAALTLCVTAFSLGLGTVVLWVGVPILAATMMFARGFASAERARIGPVLGQTFEDPTYRTGTGVRRLLAPLADPQSWRDLAHAILRFIPSTFSFTVVVTWWSMVLGGLTWGLWGWALPDGPNDHNLPEWVGLHDSYGLAVAFYLVVAVLFAITLPIVVRGVARLEAGLAHALLVYRAR